MSTRFDLFGWGRLQKGFSASRQLEVQLEVRAMAADLAALRKPNTASGYRNVKLTTSKKRPFQAWMKDLETGKQRQLGTFETADEAAEVVAAALRDGPNFSEPAKKRNKRGTVRAPAHRACPASGPSCDP